ncbi:PWI domain-containing protein [Epithele typhae]|uniref:PWI domain-containing protein n=1 Tax=Epithele typhae TaxID=378194 RepID=UPI0020085426|nr:PWI domain-containing protein [Epithele typhae]KAH9941877.1 PWI domain-containing protein [Epithele typhae]
MADAGFFKGTSADQDRRFSDKELKLLKTMKFPSEFDKKVDMRKVNLSVIRPWIVKKVVELVGFEDEVVVEYAMGLLEDDSQPTPDPRKMQINLTGFLTNSTPAFMTALWTLLLEAQDSPAGVPRTFVEEKKEEMRLARAGDTRAIEERDRRARLDDEEEAVVVEDSKNEGTVPETVDGELEAGRRPSPFTPTAFITPTPPSFPLRLSELSLSFSHTPPPSLASPWRSFAFPHTPCSFSSKTQASLPFSLSLAVAIALPVPPQKTWWLSGTFTRPALS